MFSGAAVLAGVVLLVSLETGFCTSCYQCTSTNNPNCKDPFNNPKAVSTFDCNTNTVSSFYNSYLSTLMSAPQTINAPKYCLKMILGGSLGDTVVRTCTEGPSNNPNRTCSELESRIVSGHIANNLYSLKHCSVCTGENCNGGSVTSASVILAATVATALAYLAH